ncbi:MAG: ROK family protein [Propionibacteriaceae bacterium]|jgi:predicted NBD/HSP70 family sugar kinase|nr:ROK family protein [Propionibacteriaceae bacterium]
MVQGTSEDVRRLNLSTILTSLYLNGPSSRSQLSARSGRNRSTVGSLVADLVALGLVDEQDPAPSGMAGRPSPIVSLRPDVAAIAVNPEIDVLTISVVGLDSRIIQTIKHSYSEIPSADEAISITAAVIQGLVSGPRRVVGVGVAVPGQVRSQDGVVTHAPHLHWIDVPFAAPLSELTGLPVAVANDASLGARAERAFGAGRGVDNLLYLNGGASGIGGGIVAGGTSLLGSHGYAGELGHVRVSDSTVRDSAGMPGTLEALVTRAQLLETVGLGCSEADLLEERLLADRSDATAAVVHQQLYRLGLGLANAVNLLNPELVVLGGFLATLLRYDADFLNATVHEAALGPSAADVKLVASELGPRLLPTGAAQLAFEPLLNDPASY